MESAFYKYSLIKPSCIYEYIFGIILVTFWFINYDFSYPKYFFTYELQFVTNPIEAETVETCNTHIF